MKQLWIQVSIALCTLVTACALVLLHHEPGPPGDFCFTVAEYYRLARRSDLALLDAYHQVQSDQNLGCAARVVEGVSVTRQQFQGGTLILLHTGRPAQTEPKPPVGTEGGFIYAIVNKAPLRFIGHRDFWLNHDGEPIQEFLPPPDGLLAPWFSFETVWAGDTALRNDLGWAVEEVAFETATVIFFGLQEPTNNPDFPNSRRMLARIEETGVIYTFGDPMDQFDVQVILPQ